MSFTTAQIKHSKQFSFNANGELVFKPTLREYLPNYKTQSPLFLVVDLFCGAGGTTTGFDQGNVARNKVAKVIACVNHDHKAIISHWRNHPGVFHFEEDIRILDLSQLVALVKYYRILYPEAKLLLHASLECTNFSKAKGGQPRDADSRTLADHLERYVTAIDPDLITIENVVEFMSWGPLDENGKPVSRKNGSDFMRWCREICNLGYLNDWKELNSANFGAFTSRNRLFGVFAKPGLPTCWPEPTHSKNPSKFSMHGDLQKWKAVKEVLNFEDEGISIFDRKKPLSDKTLERIYAGLIKYVANGDTSFISKYYSGKPSGKNISIDGPAGTIRCVDCQALVQTEFLLQTYAANSKSSNTFPVDAPSRTITTRDATALVQPEFLAAYYGNGDNVSSVLNPCPTVPTKDRFGLVQPEYFIDKHFGTAQNQSINQPAGTIMPNDKHRLVEVNFLNKGVRLNCNCGNFWISKDESYLNEPCPNCGEILSGHITFLEQKTGTPFIMPTNYDNKPKSVEDPLQTITADRHHNYLVNPSHGGHVMSTEGPCPVIVARQDKAPLYLVQAEKGNVRIAVYEGDSAIAIKIKEFMVIYNLIDIKMRMLRVLELLKIQGFPEDYQLEGNQSDQKKFIGNSVVPQVVKAWVEAMAVKLISQQDKKAA